MMRLDRFLTLHVFKHLTAVLPQRGLRIPILMYHSISDEPESGHPYYWINTSPRRFAEHMKYLHKNGYSVINLSEAARIISPGSSGSANSQTFHHSNIPQKKVVLTFDDGYKDFYTQAFPVLKEYDFCATIFLPTKFIGNRKLNLRGKEHLGWKDIKELHKVGVAFGSHTVSHPHLKSLDKSKIEHEVKESKVIIEDEIGKSVESFSYPFAFPEEDKEFINYMKDTLEESGYKNGVSTRIGTITEGVDRYFLKRIPVNSFDDIPFLEAKLQAGYDWIYRVQYYSKLVKKSTN
jgi:peptidoglycan/xylan/chitin deacetylase (PgdA/CDA1 family)